MKTSIILCLISLYFSPYLFAQQKNITRIESVQSLYLEVYKDNIGLGSATGFVIKSNTKSYLITNWHVVTNKNPITKEWLYSNQQVTPNKIIINHNGKKLGTYNPKVEKLIDDNGNVQYLEYKIGNEMVDVVALPLNDTLENITIYPVNYTSDTDSILIQPTDRLFVLGFPKGAKSAPFMPIWKSGLIASEPEIDQENKPIIWLDIDSYGGMSGAPVYLITDKLYDKKGNTSFLNGNASFFMGVFSHGQNNINVGALWKAEFLRMIFKNLP